MSRNRQSRDYFSDTGPLARSLPGYDRRPQQAQASAVIAGAMRTKGGVALIEAATGVGKTLAYLLPALHYATPDRKVIISTHSLALQAQLIERDIPFVQSIAPNPLWSAVLKGRGNYLCLQDYDVARKELWSVADSQFAEIGEWSRKTKTGDVAELPFSYPGWIDIRANTDTCKGRECGHFEHCFYFEARREAQDAAIIVVNHALFFSDLAMRQLAGSDSPASLQEDSRGDVSTDSSPSRFGRGNEVRAREGPPEFLPEGTERSPHGAAGRSTRKEPTLLPDYAFVIFDEAHHLEAAAAGAFGVACSSSRVPSLVEKLRRLARHADIDRDRLKALESANDAIFGPLLALGRSEFTLDDALPGYQLLSARAGIAEVGTQLEAVAVGLLKVDHNNDQILRDRIDGLRRTCARTKEELTLIFTGEDENFLRWGSVNRGLRRGATVTVNWTPICVAPILAKSLWAEPREVGAALISATLATDDGFAYLRQRLGIPEAAPSGTGFSAATPLPLPVRDGRVAAGRSAMPFVGVKNDGIYELIVGSPFDFENQALLYVPKGIPPPGDDAGYLYALVNEIVALIDASRGGAFLLFTSYRTLNASFEKLAASDLSYRILRQGDMPNARLVEAFKEEPNTVLLGTQSFWEGVDIPGHALRLVVIDKLPFTTPDNPLHKARVAQITASGGDWFNDYALPQAQLKLKQGFGRLIRTSTDRGVVALMDSRIRTKAYGRRILASLPPARFTASLDDVIAFYRNIPAPELPAVSTPVDPVETQSSAPGDEDVPW